MKKVKFCIEVVIELDSSMNDCGGVKKEFKKIFKTINAQLQGLSTGETLFQSPDSTEIGHWYIDESNLELTY